MSADKLTRHSEIVQQIYKVLKKFEYNPLCAKHRAHDNPKCAEDYGKLIPLYAPKDDGKGLRLAEVDIVVPFKEDSKKIKYIIEVEESFPPKTIIGDIVACQLSKFCQLKDSKEPTLIENCKLLVVVDSEKLNVKESCKKKQFENIKEELNKVMNGVSLKNYFLVYSSKFKAEFEEIDKKNGNTCPKTSRSA